MNKIKKFSAKAWESEHYDRLEREKRPVYWHKATGEFVKYRTSDGRVIYKRIK